MTFFYIFTSVNVANTVDFLLVWYENCNYISDRFDTEKKKNIFRRNIKINLYIILSQADMVKSLPIILTLLISFF